MAEVDVYDKIRADDKKVNHLANQKELAVATEHACADTTHTCPVSKQIVVEADTTGPNTKPHCPDGKAKRVAILARLNSDSEKDGKRLLDEQRRKHQELVQLLRKIAEVEGLSMKELAMLMSLKPKDLGQLDNGTKIRNWIQKYRTEQRRKGLSAPLANQGDAKPKPKPKPKPPTGSGTAGGNAKMTPQQRKFYNGLRRSSAEADAFLKASSEDRNKLMAARRK